MKTEEYIASGVLEIYATGGLSAEERAKVVRMVQQFPEIRTELDKIEAVLEKYALAHATNPPASLKAKILNDPAFMATTASTPPTPNNTATNVIPVSAASGKTGGSESGIFRWLAIAATVLLLISAGLNFYFYSHLQEAKSALATAFSQQAELAQNIKQARLDLTKTEKALQVLGFEDTKHIVLKGLSKSPDSKATVHWDPHTKTVLLNVKKLPIAPAGHQYQLWALQNGQPIDAGLFSPSDTLMGMQQMKSISEAEAFALTLEPSGGSKNPTTEEMFLMGKM